METQLQTCYFTKKGPSLVTLFGYATISDDLGDLESSSVKWLEYCRGD